MPANFNAYVAGVPTLNRYDLLGPAIDSLLASTHPPEKIFVIDNGGACGGHPSPLVTVIRSGLVANLGVARSWNILTKLAWPADCLLFNDDVVFASRTVERLATAARGPDGRGVALRRHGKLANFRSKGHPARPSFTAE